LLSKEDERWLWHKKLCHLKLKYILKLSKKNLVRGLPNLSCKKGKLLKSSFKPKNYVSIAKPLELLHMELFDPTRTLSLESKKYGLIIIDDYSRYT